MERNLERGRLLLQQGRIADAEKEFKISLEHEPNNSEVFFLLSICKTERKLFGEAEELIQNALQKSPSNSLYLYQYSRILIEQDKLEQAENKIIEAINLNPYEADYFSIRSTICLLRKEWQKALEFANQGLQIDPENLACLNKRSLSLIKLDQKEASYDTVKEALKQDPENPYTHTNVGWGLLEQGNHKQALLHFEKSLQLDPNSDVAKAGMIKALKARYFFYRWFLKYAFWIGNMKSGMQWTFFIGLYVGMQIINYLSSRLPSIGPLLSFVFILYVIFAISTWIIEPISNLFFRLNRFGKYLLTKDQILVANLVGVALGISLISFSLLLYRDLAIFFFTGIYGVTMMIPLSSMTRPDKPAARKKLVIYTVLMALIGIFGLTLVLMNSPLFGLVGLIYILGIFAYQFVANWAISR